MAEQVNGFKTADGRFFEDKYEADYQEQGYFLGMKALDAIQFDKGDFARFNGFIEDNLELVRDFCEAAIAYKKAHPKEETIDDYEEFDDSDKLGKEKKVANSEITVTSED